MADRFTSYRGVGIGTAPVGNVDFANLREAQKSGLAMSQEADRIGNYLMKLGYQQAEIEGAKYYAENPITLQQLQEAKALGKDPEELFAGNFTAFDKAGRKVQMQQVATEIELNARTELTSMLSDVKLGKVGLEDLTDMSSGSPRPGGKLADLVDGLSSVVKDAAPEIYPAIRANLATLANSTLSSAISEYATRTQTERKVKANDVVASINNDAAGIIARGDMVDRTTGKTITVDEQLSVLEQSIRNAAVYANDPVLIKSGLDDFRKNVVKARVAAIIDWADKLLGFGGLTSALDQLTSGNIDSPQIKAAYNKLPEDKQLEVRDTLRKMRSERFANKSQEHAAAERTRNENDLVQEAAALNARSRGDTKALNAAISLMSPDKKKEWSESLRVDPSGWNNKGEGKTVADVERDILFSTKSAAELVGMVDFLESIGRITPTERKSLYGKIESRQSSKMTFAKTIISAKVRFDPQSFAQGVDKDETARRKAIYETAVSELSTAILQDPELDVRKWINESLADIMRGENALALEKAQASLKAKADYLAKNLPGYTSGMSGDDLMRIVSGASGTAKTIAYQYLDAVREIERLQRELGGSPR